MNLDNFSIGIDIEEISRFEEYAEEKHCSFNKKIYTESELDYSFRSKHPAKHLAVRFCAKEAIFKALSGFNICGVNFSKLEIYHDKNQVPQIRFLDEKFKNIDGKISLSHNKNQAIAYVLLAKNKVCK